MKQPKTRTAWRNFNINQTSANTISNFNSLGCDDNILVMWENVLALTFTWFRNKILEKQMSQNIYNQSSMCRVQRGSSYYSFNSFVDFKVFKMKRKKFNGLD